MKHLFYPFTVTLFLTCNSKDDTTINTDTISIGTAVDISYFNEDSLDLLDPEKEYTYKEKDIELFYDNVKIFNANMNHPKGFFTYI